MRSSAAPGSASAGSRSGPTRWAAPGWDDERVAAYFRDVIGAPAS
jgi:hypothetical protein